MKLYHVCNQDDLASILENGLRACAYLTSCEDVAGYYAETFEEEGEVPVYLVIDLDALVETVGEEAIEPDNPSIAEPITSAIDLSEEQVIEAWSASAGTWRDSLEIVRSVMVRLPVPASIIVHDVPEFPRGM